MPTAPSLDIELDSTGGSCTVTLHGELDSLTTKVFVAMLDDDVWPLDVVSMRIDLTDVSFINVVGLRALEACHAQAVQLGVPCRVVVSPGRVLIALQATGLTDVLDLDYFRAGSRAPSRRPPHRRPIP